MSKKKTKPSRGELVNLYINDHKNLSEIGDVFGVSYVTVRNWLKSYNIKLRSKKRQKKIYPTKEEFLELFLEKQKTLKEIAKLYQINKHDIRKLCKLYGVKTSKKKAMEKIENEQFKSSIIDSYLVQKKTLNQISKEKNLNKRTISKILNDSNVEKRTLSDTLKIKKNTERNSRKPTKEEFLKLASTHTFIELQSLFNIGQQYLKEWMNEFGIDITSLKKSGVSKQEIAMFEHLKLLFPNDNWEISNNTLIPPKEVDIVNHTKKIAIEYCGLYWHSENSGKKESYYHAEKLFSLKELGYELITVFESDNIDKVLKMLYKKLGKIEKKVGARQCIVKNITSKESSKFHETHHINGNIKSKINIGLFYDDELVQVGSFSKSRYSKEKNTFECYRMTSHSDIMVVGGISKIINFFKNNYEFDKLISYSDLRFGEGLSYLKAGFEFESYTKPNYWYFDKSKNKLFSRIKFQKHKLKTELNTFDPALTEFQNMVANGWDRIWDCGNAKYVLVN